jgi:transglutaminase-like putative cysteine protease
VEAQAIPAAAGSTSVAGNADSGLNPATLSGNYDPGNTMGGSIGVRYLAGGDARIKTRVQKETTNYDYDLFGRSSFEYFPMQLGNGDYAVTIFENVADNRYRVAEKQVFNSVVKNLLDVFRNSIQTVHWNRSMKTILKAAALCTNLKTESEKIQAIYQFVTKNIQYDYTKIKTLQSTYVPDIDKILAAGKGICYDYSAVFAAMLRSQGIPAKLVKGYTDNVKEYHAWNEVYLSGEKRWIVVDTTFDSVYVAAGRKATMEKDAGLYRAGKEY